MRTECPNYLSKVAPIIGDCMKPNLGMNENDRNTLISEAEIIFHVAATVRFDAQLRDAVNINIRATNDLLDLAHSMKQLKVRLQIICNVNHKWAPDTSESNSFSLILGVRSHIDGVLKLRREESRWWEVLCPTYRTGKPSESVGEPLRRDDWQAHTKVCGNCSSSVWFYIKYPI